ncbi:type III secretion system cytoplasmic ring protein SctQ [Litchfieldella rifensis]|uniref:Type III secretion system cytoplasmic ring protein SctQ n=1 Tax=Litchfieldella rifensis TaxID=762643 RepID=A0ABV7LI58_9GAMM
MGNEDHATQVNTTWLTSPRLTRIAPESVTTLNALNRPRASLVLSLGDRTLSCHRHHDLSSISQPLTFGLTIGGEPATLEISPDTLAVLTEHLALHRPLEMCSPELRALWLEYALLEWIEPLEAQLGRSLRLHDDTITATDSFPIRLPLRLETGGRNYALSLSLTVTTARALLPLLDSHCSPTPKPCPAVPWPLQWIAGHQDLALAELRHLAPGDVVMLERPAQGMAVVIGGWLLADVDSHHGGVRLLSPPYAQTRGDFNMAQSSSDATANRKTSKTARSSMDDAQLDQLPVRLVCELGRLELSLGELRELDQGSVLPLSRPMEEAVDIVVNGRRMGRGRLVEIGDGLGVQIVRLATDE